MIAVAEARELPFSSREMFVYKAKWGILNAGEAVIETLPSEIVNGMRVWHFAMTTSTSGSVDQFYPIRERQDSYVNENFTHSLQYEKRAMGKNPREVVVYFNWRQMQAVYANFGDPHQPVSIVPGTFDPLSMFFAIRMQPLREGSSFIIPITDGKKLIQVRALVTGREKVAVNNREYDTYVVVPDFDLKQAFEKEQPRLKIWFSADKKHIPVKIRSSMKLGTVDFELVSAVL